jgi:hypothetical protein
LMTWHKSAVYSLYYSILSLKTPLILEVMLEAIRNQSVY